MAIENHTVSNAAKALTVPAVGARIEEYANELDGIKDILDMLVDTQAERDIDNYAVLNLLIRDTTRIRNELRELAEIAMRSEGAADAQ